MHRLWSCVKIQKIGFDVAKVLSDIFNFPVPLYVPLNFVLPEQGFSSHILFLLSLLL